MDPKEKLNAAMKALEGLRSSDAGYFRHLAAADEALAEMRAPVSCEKDGVRAVRIWMNAHRTPRIPGRRP